MKNYSVLWTTFCLASLLVACVSTEKGQDLRFTHILGKPIEITEPLYLYQLNAMRNGDPSRHSLSMSKMIMDDESTEIIAILPTGHRVTFENLRKTPQSGGVTESLVGITVYQNVQYPVTYLLGFSGAEIGWKESMRAFENKE